MHRTLLALVFALIAIPAAAAPKVLATIKPIHSLAAAVMAGIGTPELLIGGAVSEHSYVLKPSDAAKIAEADIVFWVGPDLETYLKTPLANLASRAHVIALEHAPGMHLLAARPGGLWHTPQRRASDGNINPHVWLDPANAIAMVQAMEVALAKTDPAHAARYHANAIAEAERIAALDKQVGKIVQPVRHVPFIVFHDAYPYFEAHYGLDAIGAVTVEPDRPVSPRRVLELRAALKAGKARCIFREPQFPPALIATLAAGTKARIGVLDPLGAELKAGPGLYGTLMTNLAKHLKACLGGSAP